MRRGNFTMLKDATGIRWFSRSRIPIINPESVKLVGISLEIADRHRFTHDIFIVYVLMTWNITAAPHICIHAYTRIYVYSPMLSNDNNNWNNREQFSSDSVIYIYFNEQVNSRLPYTVVIIMHRAFPLIFVLSFTERTRIIISCNFDNFNLSFENKWKSDTQRTRGNYPR